MADGMGGRPLFTYDSGFTRDSTGSFLVGELERLDQTIHAPLVAYTYGRDIQMREDVTIADEVSSFTNSAFAAAGGIIPGGIRRHEACSFEDDITILFERSAIGMLAIRQLGVVDRMRLLPDQQRTDRRRTVTTFGSNHFWPSCTCIALKLRLLAS